MGNIITGWEFGALLTMVALLFGFLEMMNVRERLNSLRDAREEDKAQAEEDERERRRMVHEDDSGFEVHGSNIIVEDSVTYPPSFGEWQKKRERKQERRAAEPDSPSPLLFGVSADAEPSRSSIHSSYSGGGGLFDGGGAFGDWSSSSSSSSDSGSCSSSSSDSGSSSCSSSD